VKASKDEEDLVPESKPAPFLPPLALSERNDGWGRPANFTRTDSNPLLETRLIHAYPGI
jgi:hypothetical protein